MINKTNNQITELSINELEAISGGGLEIILGGRTRTPEEEAQEKQIAASLEGSRETSVFGTLNALKAQAEVYIK